MPQLIGFLVFLVASFAETNRLPFDLPEAESELVAGFHTEYSAMRFASFFMAEYISMAALAALGVTLYFGGWSLPGVELSNGWLGRGVGLAVADRQGGALHAASSSGCAGPSRASATTSSCGSAGRCCCRSPSLNLIAVAAMTLGGWL